MVRLSTPSEVLDLLNAVKTNPKEYRAVVLSSPFIDDPMQRKLVALGTVLRRASGVLRVITRREPADRLNTKFAAQRVGPIAQLFIVQRLHAKVYLAIGRCIPGSRAISNVGEPNGSWHDNIHRSWHLRGPDVGCGPAYGGRRSRHLRSTNRQLTSRAFVSVVLRSIPWRRL